MSEARPWISRIELSGFKSIRRAEINLTRINVLIGANGSGKSNLVSFFELLRASLGKKLQEYVARHGGPGALLYLGPKQTSEIVAALTLRTPAGTGTLHQRLVFSAPDTLADPGTLAYGIHHPAVPKNATMEKVDEAPHATVIAQKQNGEQDDGNPLIAAGIFICLSQNVHVYHFHDTTLASPIRTASNVEDNRVLRGDAGNLAPFLHRLKITRQKSYERIRETVRMVAPFFDDFSLAPRALNPREMLLNWKQLGSDVEFGPHQLSDGTLRAMALIALLLQPEEELPDVILIDEPELGLHPYALNLVASLLKAASAHSQVIVATQSAALVDEFKPQDVIVVDRRGPESIFSRPDTAKLQEWLEEYSLGEVWRKNIFGGGAAVRRA
ncbi:MAG: AAA family ATPase [Planctomycetia bacterium]|nr:AAA family ATPase [Planctomycetia bacterium]